MAEPKDDIRLHWLFVERSMNWFFLEVNGLEPSPRSSEAKRLIKEKSFQKKLDFLRQRGLFTDSEIDAITTFQHERNRAFHDSLDRDMVKSFFDDEEIKRLSELGDKAFNAVEDARERKQINDCEVGREYFLAKVS